MKTLFKFTIAFGILFLYLTSCEDMMGDFLEKPPGVDVTEDTIFSSQINAERFLMGIYREGMYSDMPEWSDRDGWDSDFKIGYSDEGKQVASWYNSVAYNQGNMSNTRNPLDSKWSWRWRAIRAINIFLERIDDVPDASQEYKNQAKGQALFIRGMNYLELYKRYGGVPLIDIRITTENPENLSINRSTLEETVNFIIKDAEEAAALLPDKWPSQYTGKVTKGAALMLKSRTLLYAASPLSNTATPPLSLPGEDNKLICYGNYDANRWKLAADAAKAVIDWAPGAGIRLLSGSDRSYQDTWEVPDNAEVIMTPKMYSQSQSYSSSTFKSLNNFYMIQGGIMITQNFVERYEKKDGTLQVWNRNGGNDIARIYADMDPRFRQSVAYNGSYWNVDFPELKFYEGGVPDNQPPRVDNMTGYWIRKWIPTTLTRTVPAYINWHWARLAEAYLNYAEALNEYQGPTPEAYQAVNTIRNRVGMPDLPANLTQVEFREKVRNERAVELAFEDHRLWDLMRWCMAEDVLNGPMWGLKIYKLPEPSTEFQYEYYIFEERTWKTPMYRLPFNQGEIDKGYLVQNPGW
jgi:hypothetical protein